MPPITVTSDPLDLDALVQLVSGSGGFGAITTFIGVVRDNNQGRRVTHLEYEAYEPLAVKALEQIRGELAAGTGVQQDEPRAGVDDQHPRHARRSPGPGWR